MFYATVNSLILMSNDYNHHQIDSGNIKIMLLFISLCLAIYIPLVFLNATMYLIYVRKGVDLIYLFMNISGIVGVVSTYIITIDVYENYKIMIGSIEHKGYNSAFTVEHNWNENQTVYHDLIQPSNIASDHVIHDLKIAELQNKENGGII